MNQFDGPLVIKFDHRASRLLGGEYYRVMKSFRFYLPTTEIANEWTAYNSDRWVFVSAGMLTDLGTAPGALKKIINSIPQALQPYVVHDQLCEYLSVTHKGLPELITRQEADLILFDALIASGVGKSKANIIYNAVAALQMVCSIKEPSTYALKRRLESEFNYEDFQ